MTTGAMSPEVLGNAVEPSLATLSLSTPAPILSPSDIANTSSHPSSRPTKPALPRGPQRFIFWASAISSLLDGAPDPDAVLRLSEDVLHEHAKLKAQETPDIQTKNIRSWNVSLKFPACAGTKAAELLREEFKRISAPSSPTLSRSLSSNSSLVSLPASASEPWWFILNLQRDEPQGAVPKFGGIILNGDAGGGAPGDGEGEWWISHVCVAPESEARAMQEMMEYILID